MAGTIRGRESLVRRFLDYTDPNPSKPNRYAANRTQNDKSHFRFIGTLQADCVSTYKSTVRHSVRE